MKNIKVKDLPQSAVEDILGLRQKSKNLKKCLMNFAETPCQYDENTIAKVKKEIEDINNKVEIFYAKNGEKSRLEFI